MEKEFSLTKIFITEKLLFFGLLTKVKINIKCLPIKQLSKLPYHDISRILTQKKQRLTLLAAVYYRHSVQIRKYSEDVLTSVLQSAFNKLKCIKEDHITPFQTVQNFLFCSFSEKNTTVS